MLKKIMLAPELSLPVDVVTETIAFLAGKGYGKTYGATKLAEEMMAAGAQIVALDPVGKWWSLRLNADGKTAAEHEPVIFGGLHGDLPLEPTGGALVADIIVDHGRSAVLDVSTMTSGEQSRFAADFANRLRERKSRDPSPTVLHVFLEEAQEFLPQRPQPDEARMLGAWLKLVKMGRNWGVGLTMISQRPQAVSKEALNLTSILFVGNLAAKLDRRAIEEWVVEQGKQEQADGYLRELPNLKKGEMICWSPGDLNFLGKIHIHKKKTLDASATPKLGGVTRKQIQTKPIDTDAFKAAMAETLERRKNDDPKELRKRIAELEREVHETKSHSVITEVPPKELAAVEKRLRDEADYIAAMMKMKPMPTPWALRVLKGVTADAPAPRVRRETIDVSKGHTFTPVAPKFEKFKPVGDMTWVADGEINSSQMKMLKQLDQSPLTGRELAVYGGFAPTGGTVAKYISGLKTAGYIRKEGGRFAIESTGARLLNGNTAALPTTEELYELWAPKVGGGPASILRLILDKPGISKQELADATGFAFEGGTLAKYISTLKTAALIDKDGGGFVPSTEILVSG